MSSSTKPRLCSSRPALPETRRISSKWIASRLFDTQWAPDQLTHVVKRADDHDDRDHHDQQQQRAAGAIIGPTMMIMMVLPVLSLTAARVRDRSRRSAI